MADAEEEYIIPEDETDTQYHVEDSKPSVIDTLSGQQKAMALLVAMGKPTAGRLITYLSPDELRTLSSQARNLPDIKMPDFEKLVRQFEDAFTEGASFSQAEERFTSLVRETLPEEEATAVLDPKLSADLSHANVFEIINRMTAEELQPYLANEHPQIVAYIVSRLPDEIAAKVLLAQTPAVRSSIVQRILDLKPVHAATDAILSQALHPALARQITGKQKSHYKQIAMVLNRLDRNELDEVMASLDSLKEEDMSSIRARMFMFEDISRLTSRARLLLFDGVTAEVIITALRNTDATLTELVLASLPQRTRRMVEAELATPDIELSQDKIVDARREIADTALKLADQGKIHLNAEGTAA